jgi:hypothetical protein
LFNYLTRNGSLRADLRNCSSFVFEFQDIR